METLEGQIIRVDEDNHFVTVKTVGYNAEFATVINHTTGITSEWYWEDLKQCFIVTQLDD